ncbi:MAG: SiaC family regulatory phosphoprotein, partial [Flavobacteriales bacterium]|nr:SiaC family regulatory phosphoprotein [Flavobacteriales bacterium]
AKYLLDIFRLLEDLHREGRSKVRLEWRCASDDLDMQEAGNDYRQLLEFPVKVVLRQV